MNYCDDLFSKSLKEPKKPLFIEVDTERTATAEQLRQEIQNFASHLLDSGISAGDVVTIHLYNSINFVIAHMAVQYIGAVSCLIDPLLQPKSLPYYLEETESKLFLSHKTAEQLGEGTSSLVEVLDDAQITEFSQKKGESEVSEMPFVWEDDAVAYIYYTSGTTSLPKGVMLSSANHKNFLKITDTYWQPVDNSSKHVGFVPFSHGFGSILLIPLVIRTEGELHIFRSFHPGKVFDSIEKDNLTHIYGVPSHYQQLLRSKNMHPILKKLKMAFCAAAKLEPKTMAEWKEVTGFYLDEGYGLIETTTGIAWRMQYPLKQPSPIGICPDPTLIEIGIMDEENNLLPTGEEGEIVVRGKSVMKGYLKKPEENERVFVDGWFKTGDKGYISEEKELFMSGRIKDIINVAGIKISPYEVEAVLNEHDAVEQSIVISTENELYGEVVKAFVKTKLDATVTERELIRFSAQELMSIQVPKEITFLDTFPMNNMGKIDRKALRA